MSKHMLIDATHPEETRVAVVDGKRLEEFDVEIASRKPLKGNIYLAKVTRVEPSLQAAFVEYGGNRHGFLAFSEIHPDYYRIPVADREALKRETSARYEEDSHREGGHSHKPIDMDTNEPAVIPSGEGLSAHDQLIAEMVEALPEDEQDALLGDHSAEKEPEEETLFPTSSTSSTSPSMADMMSGADLPQDLEPTSDNNDDVVGEHTTDQPHIENIENIADKPLSSTDEPNGLTDDPEADEERARKRRLRALRRYKIQEVIKRRQIMLVQVTKEERGNKGAALTTYLSLAGRYCVLMPNTDRGGGISRRITNANDRKRLKTIISELDAPHGMAVILRTAGSERSKIEIRRDYEYLIRLWDDIRELTLKSTAPALIYEEADLIKRSIRDLYSRDIEDVIVAGEDAQKAAKDFMRMLMPSHAKRVRLYKESIPLFQRYQIESQIAAIHDPIVQLKSGGYIVLNQTEALVAIDVNSGRSTRERNIEETALRTNLEAADEIARQLRLRDLAGLVVIDFIDMDEGRHNSAVEKRLKEALRNDRARIQLGRISTFGLMEMSRQRLNPSLSEASTGICPHCNGTGRIRSVDSTALHILRIVEEDIARQPAIGANIYVPTQVALYMLNQKRQALAALEMRHGIRLYIMADDDLVPPAYRLERLRELAPGEEVAKVKLPLVAAKNQRQRNMPLTDEEEEVVEETSNEELDEDQADSEENLEITDQLDHDNDKDPRRRRRRGRRGGRRRSGKRRDESDDQIATQQIASEGEMGIEDEAQPVSEAMSDARPMSEPASDKRRPRRRHNYRSRRHTESNTSDSNVNVNERREDIPTRSDRDEVAKDAPIQAREEVAPYHPAMNHDHQEHEPRDTQDGAPEGKQTRKGWWKRLVE